MFEHLFNCHGEWQALFAALGSIPFIGYWFRDRFLSEDCNEEG
jgi:hypothetical protein